jgi:hypothetical protein
MALTKVGGDIIRQPLDIGSLNATTVQIGAATTVHTTGIDVGSGSVTGHNIHSTGIVTATSFVGPVTGNLTGNVTGNADTASNLIGSPSITVTNITAAGNVSIAGTLTYEDVTNIDAVGVVTARAGVNISGGNFQVGGTTVINSGRALYNLEEIKLADTKELVLGSGNDLKIHHSGSHSFISQEGVGALKIKGDDIRFEDAGGTEALRIDDVGRLLIGRTSALASSAERLTIDDGMAMFRRSSTNAAALYIRNEDSTADTRQPYLIFTDGGGNRGGFGVQYNQSSLWISGQNGIAFRTGGTAPSTTERVRITSAGNVGIGTDNTGYKLELHGATGSSSLKIGSRITNSDYGIAFGYFDESAGKHGFGIDRKHAGTLTTNAFIVRADTGNVGINSTAPRGKLDIGFAGAANYITFGSDSDNPKVEFFRSTGGSPSHYATEIQQVLGDFVLSTASAANLGSHSYSEKLRVTSTGKLKITGTTNGELNIKAGSGSGNDIISFENSGGTQRGNITYDTDNNFLFFNVSQSERTRIDQNGTLSHGTTTDNPGDANTNTGFAIRANGKYFFSCASDGGHINRNNAGYVLHARYGGGHKGGVYVNSTNTSFQTSSDYRLKENVVNLDGAITRVKQLTPRRFNFIVEPNDTIDGFIAHEAATVVPEAVTGTYNEVDSNGDPVYQGIDNGKLVPLLTAALQEAIAKIETLEAAVTALQGS